MAGERGDEIYIPDFGWCEVTNRFDADGEEIEDMKKAAAVVAKTPDGRWVSITLGDLEPMSRH